MKVVLTPPAPLAVKKCRGCDARIVWATTDYGKRMPVDVLPALAGCGTLVLYTEQLGDEVLPPYRVKTASVEEAAELKGRLWMSHFATCPKAKSFRGGRQP